MNLHDRSVYMTFEQNWTTRSVFKRALSVVRDEGFHALWFKLLGETCYRRMYLIAIPLEKIGEPGVTNPDLHCRWLYQKELAAYLQLRPDAGRERIRKRFFLGHRCFAAFHQNRLVFAAWVVTRNAWIPYLSRDFPLETNEVYFYEVWTSPEFRGRSIACSATLAMLTALKADLFEKAIAVVMPENKAALHLFHKAGFRIIGKLRTLKFGKWQFEISSRQKTPRVRSQTSEADYWNRIWKMEERSLRHPDPFLLRLKNQAYQSLVRNWGGIPQGTMLKTDLFEETLSSDGYMRSLAQGVKAVGIDISFTAARHAAIRQTGSGILCTVSDVRNMPFADNTFDFVLSPSTLDHFDNPGDLKSSLVELRRVLKAGGRMIITLDNRQNIFDPLLRLVNRLGMLPYFVGYSLNAKTLRSSLAKAGFHVLDTTAILHNPRLVAVALIMIARKCRIAPLTRLLERSLIAAQRLENTSLKYRTGSFIAAHAVKPE